MLRNKWAREIGIDDLPIGVKGSQTYSKDTWWVSKIRLSFDGLYIGIWFENGDSHLWQYKTIQAPAYTKNQWVKTETRPDDYIPNGEQTWT